MVRQEQKNNIKYYLETIPALAGKVFTDGKIIKKYPAVIIKSQSRTVNEVIDNSTYDDKLIYSISIILPIDNSQFIVKYNDNLFDELEELVVNKLRSRQMRNDTNNETNKKWQDLRVVDVESVNDNAEINVVNNVTTKNIVIEVDTLIQY